MAIPPPLSSSSLPATAAAAAVAAFMQRKGLRLPDSSASASVSEADVIRYCKDDNNAFASLAQWLKRPVVVLDPDDDKVGTYWSPTEVRNQLLLEEMGGGEVGKMDPSLFLKLIRAHSDGAATRTSRHGPMDVGRQQQRRPRPVGARTGSGRVSHRGPGWCVRGGGGGGEARSSIIILVVVDVLATTRWWQGEEGGSTVVDHHHHHQLLRLSRKGGRASSRSRPVLLLLLHCVYRRRWWRYTQHKTSLPTRSSWRREANGPGRPR